MTSIQDILSSHADEFLKTYIDGTNSPTVTAVRDDDKSESDNNHVLPIADYLPFEQIEKRSANIDIAKLIEIVQTMKTQLNAMLNVLSDQRQSSSWLGTRDTDAAINKSKISNLKSKIETIEGVFNGEKMVGADGKEYHVPPNYASKSKLVEGDMMKLTITEQGKFIYKQIGPIERQRVVGALSEDTSSGCWQVSSNNRSYRILTASVTFYRGAVGDNVVILVPKDGESAWGAVENIFHLSA